MPIAQPLPTPVTHTEMVNRARKFFVPCIGGYNTTDGTEIAFPGTYGIEMPDNKVCSGVGAFTCPEDFVSGLSVKGHFTSAVGDVYIDNEANFGADGEGFAAHTVGTGYGAITVIAGRNTERSASLAALAKGDIVNMIFRRDAVNAADTTSDKITLFGWIVEYTADM